MVAAGSGSRFGAPLPKALVELDSVALVRRSVDALVAAGVTEVVVTIPDGYADSFTDVLAGSSAERLTLVVGGAVRQDSVALGLAALSADDQAVVLVHDAARALVPVETVKGVIDAVRGGAEVVIPVVPVIDSIRRLDGTGSAVVDRADLRAVQTPQAARLGHLRSAHALVALDHVSVTDDAAVCEYAGRSVTLVAGHRDALKITEPVDLVLAEAILVERQRG